MDPIFYGDAWRSDPVKIEALVNLSFVKGGTMEGSDMNVSEKMDMVSTDMGMVMSGHQHGAHYRGMDGPGDESGKFILAV